MSCYLCAYQTSRWPQQAQSLPPGSPAKSTDDLGTCSTCAVWACSSHGTRYAKFECAICTPATATKQVIVAGGEPSGTGGAAASLAHLAGLQADQGQRQRMSAALGRIRDDLKRSHDMRLERNLVVPPSTGEANLVVNLAEVIRGRTDLKEGMLPTARGTEGEYGRTSIDAVAAVVRNTFATTEIAESDDLETTVMGALLLALSVAHEPVAQRLAAAPRDWATAVEVVPPWAVSHPGLLDPVMWMIGTAYDLA